MNYNSNLLITAEAIKIFTCYLHKCIKCTHIFHAGIRYFKHTYKQMEWASEPIRLPTEVTSMYEGKSSTAIIYKFCCFLNLSRNQRNIISSLENCLLVTEHPQCMFSFLCGSQKATQSMRNNELLSIFFNFNKIFQHNVTFTKMLKLTDSLLFLLLKKKVHGHSVPAVCVKFILKKE